MSSRGTRIDRLASFLERLDRPNGWRARQARRWLRHAGDLRPVASIALFALYQSLVFLRSADAPTALLLVAAPYFFLHVSLMNVLHFSVHRSLFRSARVELAFGVLCAIVLGFTRSCFRLDHITHHRHYLDPARDTNPWRCHAGPWGRQRYALTHFLTVYPRTWQLAKRKGRRVVVIYLVEIAALAGPLAFLLAADPAMALAVFVAPMGFNVFAVYYWAHHQHAGLDSADPLFASRTFENRLFNWLTFNVGYHAAHHFRPALHWTELPALHSALEPHIPRELVLRSVPWFSSEYGSGRP